MLKPEWQGSHALILPISLEVPQQEPPHVHFSKALLAKLNRILPGLAQTCHHPLALEENPASKGHVHLVPQSY